MSPNMSVGQLCPSHENPGLAGVFAVLGAMWDRYCETMRGATSTTKSTTPRVSAARPAIPIDFSSLVRCHEKHPNASAASHGPYVRAISQTAMANIVGHVCDTGADLRLRRETVHTAFVHVVRSSHEPVPG
ncbi:hypothetical protein PROPHIGD39-2_33 [Mycobacterium phage prophiGD39-2]|nr:hypothetical protein PHIGD57-1_68 [Mycobacterium phage phiGD57-1]QST88927.1 hypothetical protein PROPHIGD57-1_34 [Mycobacterium phage prophiGD25-1]QST89187.1 hypothetical protein PROPHIGD39-2_33 [Mycobacterium phage prophiGD39-2]QST89733.1 hypothetical protein PROPHIGD57-1_34 [Mycobacterium phage prophi57-1]